MTFRVWAPRAVSLDLELVGPTPTRLPMRPEAGDVFEVSVPYAKAGLDYYYVNSGGNRLPDPRSRYQPHGTLR